LLEGLSQPKDNQSSNLSNTAKRLTITATQTNMSEITAHDESKEGVGDRIMRTFSRKTVKKSNTISICDYEPPTFPSTSSSLNNSSHSNSRSQNRKSAKLKKYFT
jgi:hypothetical protein